MGVRSSPLLDLIEKFRSWTSLGKINTSACSSDLDMADKSCCQCELKFSELCQKYSCLGCRRLLCASCVRGSGARIVIATYNGNRNGDHLEKVIKACKFCSKPSKRHIEKIYPADSPRASPEPLSPSATRYDISSNEIAERTECDCVSQTVGGFQDHNFSSQNVSCSRMLPIVAHPSQISLHHSPLQSDDEPEESGRHFFSSASEYCHDSSDIDTSSLSFRNECYSFRSADSSPLDSPSRFNINTPRVGCPVQQTRGGSPESQHNSPSGVAILKGPDQGTGFPANDDGRSHEVIINDKGSKEHSKPLDFENNGRIWFPPAPEDDNDEEENNFFEYNDDDDVEESGGVFSSTVSLPDSFPAKESQNEEQGKPFRSAIQSHFRALVSQLLQGEGIKFGKENGSQDWLDIVSNLSWQAANFVKPDTSKGGRMDPGNYVKIKCIAAGSPYESTLIKGIVCIKNIKHKRMTSQYKTPRLLILGGSLEYQRVQNQLASFDTLLEEEMNHLKVIVSKIEAHRPNVLLVEKSVSSYVQEYLLQKEISLVLNVKRHVLERIARCTGAFITPSVDKIPVAQLGHCELFRLERVSEVLETANQFNKRPSKTLMYFEGCPRRLGCTVLLRGLCREELKKIKHVVQYSVFAAYHLSLETSFLADEGAHLPEMAFKQSYSEETNIAADNATSTLPCSDAVVPSQRSRNVGVPSGKFVQEMESSQGEVTQELFNSLPGHPVDATADKNLTHMPWDDSLSDVAVESTLSLRDNYFLEFSESASGVTDPGQSELLEKVFPDEGKSKELYNIDENEVSGDYLATTESYQIILVSFSSRCVAKGTLCERSRLLRIKFYGSFDKPLGRYLLDDLFDQ